MYTRKTLKKMYPQTRKLARLLNELESVHNRARNLMPKLETLEFESRAALAREAFEAGVTDSPEPAPADIDF